MSEPRLIDAWRVGYTDGYRYFYNGPLYRSMNSAAYDGKRIHGAYAVEPIGVKALDLGDGTAYVIEGNPIKFVEAVELEEKAREAALGKLTEYERQILGLVK